MLLQTAMPSGPLPWWQVVGGILAIPAALLGLVYSYKLYQKTELEVRELKLKLAEREAGLLVAETQDAIPVDSFQLADDDESSSLLVVQTVSLPRWVLGTVIVLVLLIPRPTAQPLTYQIGLVSGAITAAAVWVAGIFMNRVASRRSAWRLAAVTTVCVFVAVIAWYAYAYLRVARVIVVKTGSTSIEVEAVTGDRPRDPVSRKYRFSTLDEFYQFAVLHQYEVWPAHEIHRNAIILLLSFNIGLLAIACGITAAAHVRRLLHLSHDDP